MCINRQLACAVFTRYALGRAWASRGSALYIYSFIHRSGIFNVLVHTNLLYTHKMEHWLFVKVVDKSVDNYEIAVDKSVDNFFMRLKVLVGNTYLRMDLTDYVSYAKITTSFMQ